MQQPQYSYHFRATGGLAAEFDQHVQRGATDRADRCSPRLRKARTVHQDELVAREPFYEADAQVGP